MASIQTTTNLNSSDIPLAPTPPASLPAEAPATMVDVAPKRARDEDGSVQASIEDEPGPAKRQKFDDSVISFSQPIETIDSSPCAIEASRARVNLERTGVTAASAGMVSILQDVMKMDGGDALVAKFMPHISTVLASCNNNHERVMLSLNHLDDTRAAKEQNEARTVKESVQDLHRILAHLDPGCKDAMQRLVDHKNETPSMSSGQFFFDAAPIISRCALRLPASASFVPVTTTASALSAIPEGEALPPAVVQPTPVAPVVTKASDAPTLPPNANYMKQQLDQYFHDAMNPQFSQLRQNEQKREQAVLAAAVKILAPPSTTPPAVGPHAVTTASADVMEAARIILNSQCHTNTVLPAALNAGEVPPVVSKASALDEFGVPRYSTTSLASANSVDGGGSFMRNHFASTAGKNPLSQRMHAYRAMFMDGK